MSRNARFFLVALGISLLAGCTSIQPTFTSLGNPGYRINCGGIFGDGDLGSCYQTAGEICKGTGYRISQSGVSSMIVECRSDHLNNRVPTADDPR